MDKTKDWIRMCEKAEKLQKGHIFVPGDYKSYDGIVSLIESCDSDREYYHYPYHIWLPTQDQLQDMVRSILGYTDAIGAVWKLYNAVGVNRCSPYAKLRSLEQLWLAFVVKEKYSKIWDGNDWIPETTH